jgi:post-segregation antitoxin (ccd killing protein)
MPTPVRSTDLSADLQRLNEVSAPDVDGSPAVEAGPAARPRQSLRDSDAIEDYNRFIDAGGVPLSEYRKF